MHHHRPVIPAPQKEEEKELERINRRQKKKILQFMVGKSLSSKLKFLQTPLKTLSKSFVSFQL